MSTTIAPPAVIQVRVERLQGWEICAAQTSGLEDCCLIIPTYRRPAEVCRLLRHLSESEWSQAGSVPAQVTVVDGSGDTATEAAILSLPANEFPFTLKYIRSRAGLTRQRNVGIDASHERYVFFLDDDAFPLPGYFRIIRQVFLEDSAQAIGAVGGCVINEWDHFLTWRWRIRLALRIIPRVEPMHYSHCGTSNPQALLKPHGEVRAVDLIPGCALSFRREVLTSERFSNFFEGYSNGEDVEMSLRVGRRWKVVCAGKARVIHEQAAGGRPHPFPRGRMDVRNRLMIWRRYSAAQAELLEKLRLTADFLFQVLLDVCVFLRRPWQASALLHGFGMLYAFAECAFHPPEFDESTNTIRYQVDFIER